MPDRQPPVVVVDACSLYNTAQRDLLISLAIEGAFRMVVSDTIIAEFAAARYRTVRDRKGVSERTKVERMIGQMIKALEVSGSGKVIPDTLMEPIVSSFGNSAKDRHVLAACSLAAARVLVTENLRDFPSDELDRAGVEAALDVRGFLDWLLPSLIDEQLLGALSGMADRRSRPRRWSVEELLGDLAIGAGGDTSLDSWVGKIEERLARRRAVPPSNGT